MDKRIIFKNRVSMNNNMKIKTTIFVLLLALGILLQACSSSDQQKTVELVVRDTKTLNDVQTEDSFTNEQPTGIAKPDQTTDAGNTSGKTDSSESEEVESTSLDIILTNDEIASLIYMREEEKLAKDVYLGLYDLWGLPIFQNIANSEQTHTDAVKQLLDRFAIEDPADNSPLGEFADEDLQKMYDDLMALGAQSLGDALKVGGAIEEIDILDLKESLEITQNEEIQRVFINLLRGSENHLRAFTSNLEKQTDETYQPQYMSQEDYDAILASSSPRGGRGNSKRP